MVLVASIALAQTPPADPFRQLRSSRASASSFLESNWNKYTENYHPNYALDGNAATAWVEGVDGDGEGQVLAWDTSAIPGARRVKVRVRNGYQKSDALLAANAAPRAVTLEVWDGRTRVATTTAELTRASGWQDLVVDLAGKGFDHLELRVDSVHAGSKYRDTCISDVETWVDSDVRYDAAWEKARHDELLAWVAERVATARYFAALPPTWPFASTRFVTKDLPPVEAADFERALAAATAPLESRGTFAFSSTKGAASHLPDGTEYAYWMGELLPMLRSGDLVLFEATDDVRKRVEEECDGDCWESWSNLEVEGSATRPTRARYTYVGHGEGRATTDETTEWTLGWDDRGRLVSAASTVRTDTRSGYQGMSRKAEEDVLVQLRWDEQDRVVAVEVVTRIREADGRDEDYGEWRWTHRAWTAG